MFQTLGTYIPSLSVSRNTPGYRWLKGKMGRLSLAHKGSWLNSACKLQAGLVAARGKRLKATQAGFGLAQAWLALTGWLSRVQLGDLGQLGSVAMGTWPARSRRSDLAGFDSR